MVKVIETVWSLASGDTEKASGSMAGDVRIGAVGDELLDLVGYGHAVE